MLTLCPCSTNIPNSMTPIIGEPEPVLQLKFELLLRALGPVAFGRMADSLFLWKTVIVLQTRSYQSVRSVIRY